MFTGIITDIGTIATIACDNGEDYRLRVYTSYDPDNINIGASIAHNGICLTVVEKGTDDGQGWYDVVASAHTARVTTLGRWVNNDSLNLERALKMGDELGGHMVSGHVDGIATITERRAEGDSVLFTLSVADEFIPFIAPKASITLDGVSLTVTHCNANTFSLALIPHTLDVTSWGEKTVGDKLNLEVDMLARYVVNLANHSPQQ